jgi:hypothetical protein
MSYNWTIKDIHTVEKAPTSPSRLQWKLSEVLYNSAACRCKVESINPTTGEYRIVLQGTLDVDEGTTPKFNG